MAKPWGGVDRWPIALTMVCLVLGGMLGVQVHTKRLQGATQVGRQTSALVGMLTQGQAQLEKQQEEIERLREKVARYEQDASGERGLAQVMSEELRNNRIALGLLSVKGPGIELVLGDSTMKGDDGIGGQDAFVIHDFDLLQIANELWAAGAEAVSLNGQRLSAGSAITCSGRLIEVNKVAIGSPFTFLAIGDRGNLTSALNIRDGALDRLRVLQFQVKLTPKDEVVVPAIAVAPKYKHASPALKEETQ